MKALLKIALPLALIFASTFVLLNFLGWLTLDNVQAWLSLAYEQSAWLIISLVIVLLFADLFIAVPTLSICILAGHFLGAPLGFAAAATGMMLAGLTGYCLSRLIGSKLVLRLVGAEQYNELKSTYQRHGITMILLSRAAPILPEVSACMAGVSGMHWGKFALAWAVNCLPYAAIASFAGSISTVQNPMPAIFTMIGLTGGFMLAWYIVR